MLLVVASVEVGSEEEEKASRTTVSSWNYEALRHRSQLQRLPLRKREARRFALRLDSSLFVNEAFARRRATVYGMSDDGDGRPGHFYTIGDVGISLYHPAIFA